jgi:hypothetical protein
MDQNENGQRRYDRGLVTFEVGHLGSPHPIAFDGVVCIVLETPHIAWRGTK